jgi:hypothetical protein
MKNDSILQCDIYYICMNFMVSFLIIIIQWTFKGVPKNLQQSITNEYGLHALSYNFF